MLYPRVLGSCITCTLSLSLCIFIASYEKQQTQFSHMIVGAQHMMTAVLSNPLGYINVHREWFYNIIMVVVGGGGSKPLYDIVFS